MVLSLTYYLSISNFLRSLNDAGFSQIINIIDRDRAPLLFFYVPIQRFFFLICTNLTIEMSWGTPRVHASTLSWVNCGSTSGRLDMFRTSRRSLFSHSACQDVSLSPTFTNLKQNYSVIAHGYEDKAKGKGRKTAEGKRTEGRFYISFCILNRACMWGR